MDFDVALFLTIAVIVTGVVWGFDLALLKPKRVRAANKALESLRAQSSEAPTPDIVEAATAPLLRESVLVEYAHSFFPVLFVVWLVRSFLFEPFTIPSGSMLPTLQVGDYILVNKFTYGLRVPVLGTTLLPLGKPARGDVMVFRFPRDPRINFIKRVMGVPGDHVQVNNGHVFINNVELPHAKVSFAGAQSWELYYQEKTSTVEHLIRHEEGRENASPQGEWIVPAGTYFMMGDNRDNSMDSRYWGFVPDHLIIGKASFIWMHKEPGLHLPQFGRDGKVR